MSVESVIQKIISRWWIVIITVILISLVFFPYTKSKSYQTNISVVMSFNNSKLTTLNSNSLVDGYVLSLDTLGKFLEGRFSSPEIQQVIAEKMHIQLGSFSSKSPFYKVANTGAGSASLSLETKNKEEGDKFVDGVQNAMKNIEDEWNNQRIEEFRVSHRELIINPIVEITKPPQLQILPVLAGLLVGIALTLVIPETKKV